MGFYTLHITRCMPEIVIMVVIVIIAGMVILVLIVIVMSAPFTVSSHAGLACDSGVRMLAARCALPETCQCGCCH